MDTSPKSIARPVPEPWKAALEQWQLWLSAGNRSPATIRTRLQHVRALSRDFPGGPESVTDDSLLAWVGNRQWAAETRHSHYMSFGQFFDWYSSKYGFISPGRVLPAIHRLAAPARPVPENTLLEAFGRVPDGFTQNGKDFHEAMERRRTPVGHDKIQAVYSRFSCHCRHSDRPNFCLASRRSRAYCQCDCSFGRCDQMRPGFSRAITIDFAHLSDPLWHAVTRRATTPARKSQGGRFDALRFWHGHYRICTSLDR